VVAKSPTCYRAVGPIFLSILNVVVFYLLLLPVIPVRPSFTRHKRIKMVLSIIHQFVEYRDINIVILASRPKEALEEIECSQALDA
jgi:hypothetical protein